MSRAEFEDICAPLFDRMIEPLDAAIKDAKLTKDNIDIVLMAGGSSRINKVEIVLKEYFGREDDIIKRNVNPDTVISHGACILAGILSKSDSNLAEFDFRDVIPHSIGVAVQENPKEHNDEETKEVLHVIVEKNTPFPLNAPKKVRLCTGLDNQTDARINIYQGQSDG